MALQQTTLQPSKPRVKPTATERPQDSRKASLSAGFFLWASEAERTTKVRKRQIGANPFCIQTKVAHNLHQSHGL
jgi:hypothetical protein